MIQAFQASNKVSFSKPGKSVQRTGTQRLLPCTRVPDASGVDTGEAGWLSAAGGTLLASGVGHTGGGVLTAQAVTQSAPPIMKIPLANRKKFDMILLLLEALAALLILVFIVWWTMFSGRRSGEIKPDEDAEKTQKKDHKDD
ncbi:MAG: hypothetical protein ACI9LD_000346 [Polaromonas sp.]